MISRIQAREELGSVFVVAIYADQPQTSGSPSFWGRPEQAAGSQLLQSPGVCSLPLLDLALKQRKVESVLFTGVSGFSKGHFTSRQLIFVLCRQDDLHPQLELVRLKIGPSIRRDVLRHTF